MNALINKVNKILLSKFSMLSSISLTFAILEKGKKGKIIISKHMKNGINKNLAVNKNLTG